VRDTEKKQELWVEELQRWFDEGPESDGIVLIKSYRPSFRIGQRTTRES
jgi:general stress protein 26